MKEQTGVIYEAYCLPTGLSYIGQTMDFMYRQSRHLWLVYHGSDTHFHNAIRKHGEEAFGWRFLADGISSSQLNTQEIFWIQFRNTFLGPGYNMTPGGDANPMRNPDSVEKIRKSNQQQVDDGTHNFVLNNPNVERIDDGTHHFLTEEHQKKMRENNQQRIDDGTHNFLTNHPLVNLSYFESIAHGAKTRAGMHASKQTRYRNERIAAIEAGQMFFTEEEE